MKKTITLLLVGLLLISCKKAVSNSDLAKINGYWEIQKVELPDGNKKDYSVNETIDFFKINNNKGFRQKVMPQLDGKYLTNDLKENVTITYENGDYYINYATKFNKWKEEIIEIQDSILVLKNKEDIEYHYKRQVPFSLK